MDSDAADAVEMPSREEPVLAENAAQELLLALGSRGVRYIFGNAGTDFASIVDGLARFEGSGAGVPQALTVPHESVAVAMAHGYYLVTGEPQVAMVHVTVGTANALNGLINASRANVPLVVFAGRTPITDVGSPASRDAGIHWAQESFDQAAMVREWVKWDYELRTPSMVEAVVDRAFSIATSPPRGPVYITLPREVLVGSSPDSVSGRHAGTRSPSLAHPDPDARDKAVESLLAARNPVIITSAAGADEAAVGELVRLAELLAIPVVEHGRYFVNFPTTNSLHVGYSPNRLIADADCILVVAADVPWIPSQASPRNDATVIHIGDDPIYSRYPMWQFPVDVAIAATVSSALTCLSDQIESSGRVDMALVLERASRWSTVHDKQRAKRAAVSERQSTDRPISFSWISRCLNDLKDDDMIFVNEYDLDLTQIDFDTPGSFFGFPQAGGLGWGLGAALGAALGSPDKTVIACVGDGAYMFGSPTPAHFVARRYGVPILVVVFNNKSWCAVDDAMRGVHPDGWGAQMDKPPLTDLSPSPDFEMIVRACGGYGERVEDPAELPHAIRRALHAVRVEKRQALLNVVSTR